MAYQLPTFNIVVGVRHATAASVWDPPDFVVAQLKGINKAAALGSAGGPGAANAPYMLKVPSGTDIRDAPNFAYTDLVEIDGFSGPMVVVLVYDVAFGFENEYRVALLTRQDLAAPGHAVLLPGQGANPQP